MTYTVETFDGQRGGDGLYVEVDDDRVEIDGLTIYEYHYERDGEDLYLHTRHENVPIHVPTNSLSTGFGDATVSVTLPEGLVDEIEDKLEGVPEWTY